MSEAEFNQEYLADFNVYEGQVWNFDYASCTSDLSEIDTSKMDLFAGLDVGYKDPTAFCVIGYNWDKEKFLFWQIIPNEMIHKFDQPVLVEEVKTA